MAEKTKLSKTMRIDLIPDTPTVPVVKKKQQVVIATPTRRHYPVSPPVKEGEDSGFEELLQSVYDAALISDLHGRIIDVNIRAVEFLQYNRVELTALTVFDIISGSDENLIQTLWDNLQNERFTLIQAYCLRKDGSYFPAEIAVNKLKIGEMHFCFFLRDITVRKQAEEMLRTEHNAIKNSGNGIIVADLDAEIEYANPAVAQMWGFKDTEELIGRDIRILLADRKEADELINAVIKQSETWTGEMTANRNGKGQFDIQVSAACNRNSEGDTVGMVLSFVDISDRKRAEEAVREAERTRVMLESLGAACHHLGQPATVLLANLGIIQKRMDVADNMTKELVDSSINAAESLGNILHKLNAVNEYKTTEYLKRPEGSEASDSRILEI